MKKRRRKKERRRIRTERDDKGEQAVVLLVHNAERRKETKKERREEGGGRQCKDCSLFYGCMCRLMEGCKFLGCVLVSAYHSDMGDALERESGYFNRPFNWY